MFEVVAFKLLVWAAWGGVALWLFAAFITLRGLARQKPLEAAPGKASKREDAPLISILVPARNEEGRVLTKCIRSILAQDYAPFEVVAVNDRSTDATGTILSAIAKADERMHVIEGTETPAGWLGKPHALQQALDSARGSWILATDADMIFHEAVVRTAIKHAVAGGYDAVTLIPRIESLTFWEHVLVPTFSWFMAIGMPVERVNNPVRREAIGVGGFFLLRRVALRHVGEYRAVRAEVAEDLRMAELLKQSGARLRIEYAPALMSTRMYAGLGEIWEGFTKNFFAGMQFSLLQTMASIVLVLLFIIAPFFVAIVSAVALAWGAHADWLRLLLPALTIWMIQVSTFAAVNKTFGVPLRYALTVPLGHALFVMILINSAFRIATGRGVEWKGRKVYERAGGVRPPRARQ
jgi:chlorobactene glucosyltransferase